MATPDSTTKRCKKCGKEYPASTEYFHLNRGRLCSPCKACKRLYEQSEIARQRRRAYKSRPDIMERARQLTRQRRTNPEYAARDRETSREWKRRNSERVNQYMLAYRQGRYEKLLEDSRLRMREYGRDPQHRRDAVRRVKAWRENNPEKHRRHNLTRRARERNAEGNHTSDDLKLLVRSSNGRCWWCGKLIKGNKYHVDHRIPLARGGGNNPENLVISCPRCNLSKNDKLPSEWNGRLL